MDGDIAWTSEEPSSNGDGWYTIVGGLDTTVPGEHVMEVVACDSHGNRSTRDFTVVVGPEPEPEPSPQGGSPGGADEVSGVGDESGENPFPDQGLPSATSAYVINTNSGKFHRPSCRDVKKMSAGNRWDVEMTRDEIVDRGYVPCQHCNP